jgi:hypothetical protein
MLPRRVANVPGIDGGVVRDLDVGGLIKVRDPRLAARSAVRRTGVRQVFLADVRHQVHRHRAPRPERLRIGIDVEGELARLRAGLRRGYELDLEVNRAVRRDDGVAQEVTESLTEHLQPPHDQRRRVGVGELEHCPSESIRRHRTEVVRAALRNGDGIAAGALGGAGDGPRPGAVVRVVIQRDEQHLEPGRPSYAIGDGLDRDVVILRRSGDRGADLINLSAILLAVVTP